MADSPLPAEIGEVQRIYSLALRTLWPDMADGVRIYLYDKVATAGAADITQSQIYGAGAGVGPEVLAVCTCHSCRLPHLQEVFLYITALYHIILFQLDKQG